MLFKNDTVLFYGGDNMKILTKNNSNGGNGSITLKYILDESERRDSCRLFAQVTVPPGSSIGYHQHIGESETYYIVSGSGEYNDNGEIYTVSPGDRTFTDSGMWHGIENKSDIDLVFIALILPVSK